MSWSAKRKIIIFLIVIVAIGVVVGLPTFFAFYHAPTCFDNVQNQGEEGVDCGGPCTKLCQAGFNPPVELWATSSQVVSGVYNLLAYAANPNIGVGASLVSYDFRLYDALGILLGERKGETAVPAATHFAVFEPTVTTGLRIPTKTFFEFTSVPQWQNASSSALSAVSSNFVVASTTSRLDVSILNSSTAEIDGAGIVAILYDSLGNAVAFSKTVAPSIGALGTQNISFTWPYHIGETIAKKEFLFEDNSSI